MSLADKVILITGATGALGGAVAEVFAGTGGRLALTGRDMGSLEETEAELDVPEGRLLLHVADLADPGSVDSLLEAVARRWGGMDVLLNTVGGWAGGERLGEMGLDDWDSMMEMNLRTAFLINRAVIPHMLERGWGRIVNVGSKAAKEPSPRQAGYNVSKSAVVALTRSIAADYRRRGIAANVVLPSIIDTPANRSAMPDADKSRWVRPQDLASLMLFLCSEEGGNLNGAAIPVYGQV